MYRQANIHKYFSIKIVDSSVSKTPVHRHCNYTISNYVVYRTFLIYLPIYSMLNWKHQRWSTVEHITVQVTQRVISPSTSQNSSLNISHKYLSSPVRHRTHHRIRHRNHYHCIVCTKSYLTPHLFTTKLVTVQISHKDLSPPFTSKNP